MPGGRHETITNDVLGVAIITIRCGSKLQYLHSGVHREHDHRGIRGCVHKTARVLTCDLCACGMADACCGQADPFCVAQTVYKETNKGDLPPLRKNKRENLLQTQTVNNCHDPLWNVTKICPILIEKERFQGQYPLLRLSVLDDDFAGMEDAADAIGTVEVPWVEIMKRSNRGKTIKHKSLIKCGKQGRKAGMLEWEITWQPDWVNGRYHADHKFAVPSFHQPCEGNEVTLYQDACADTDAACFSACMTPPPKCWDDIYDAWDKAKRTIFICGWSVDFRTVLKRDKKSETIETILKRKAKQGVKIYILLWLDGANQMGTSWKETMNAFANDKNIKVEAVSRHNIRQAGEGEEEGDQLGQAFVNLSFTHHQKVVVCDVEGQLTAFVGGLDLTGGRYDCQDHDLFGTLAGTHAKDFYNGCLPGKVRPEEGPREPWHDIHAKVVGPAAEDLLNNFVQRVKKQAQFQASMQKGLDFLRKQCSAKPTGSACVQIVRSIDASVCKYGSNSFTSIFADTAMIQENSIHLAYVQAIMKSKNFIYIENQYLLGSSVCWPDRSATSVACDNLVPRAIVRRIIRAIRDSKEFTAYVLIPLFPEGDPASLPSQEIIYWETQTLKYMFKAIGTELAAQKSDKSPYDFLQVYFTGRREPTDLHAPPKKRASAVNPLTVATMNAYASRRFMIYIHSKMLIVDDEYALIGSANINDRSMDGTRDSEIAMTCWGGEATKKIKDLRKNLWMEHFGGWSHQLAVPQSKECRETTLTMARANREAFVSKAVQRLPHGHMCLNLFDVRNDGSIKPVVKTFPDFQTASVYGKPSGMTLTSVVTT